jgi:hypothetical protein
MGRMFAVVLTLLAGLALCALPAGAQTGTDLPGAACHPVTGVGEMASPGAAGPVSGGTVLRALSIALQQNLALGFWRWLPVNTDPSMARTAPNLLTPRRPSSRLGGWGRS